MSQRVGLELPLPHESGQLLQTTSLMDLTAGDSWAGLPCRYDMRQWGAAFATKGGLYLS